MSWGQCTGYEIRPTLRLNTRMKHRVTCGICSMLSRMLDLSLAWKNATTNRSGRGKNFVQSLLMRSRFLKPNLQREIEVTSCELTNPIDIRRKHRRRLVCLGDQAERSLSELPQIYGDPDWTKSSYLIGTLSCKVSSFSFSFLFWNSIFKF